MCRVWSPTSALFVSQRLTCERPDLRWYNSKVWETLRSWGSSVSSRVIHQERWSLASQRQSLFPSCCHFPIMRYTPFLCYKLLVMMWTASPQHQKQQDQMTLDRNLQKHEPNDPVLDVCYNRKLTTTDHKIMPMVIRFYSMCVYQNTMPHTTNTQHFYLLTRNKDNFWKWK